jgi:hypothetical protein
MDRNYLNQFLLVGQQSGSHTGADWLRRHRSAVTDPTSEFERALGQMIAGWLRYADACHSRYESGIGDDGVLGPHWAALGAALRGLLNGEMGRLDGGTLDGLLCRTLQQEGFDPDTL